MTKSLYLIPNIPVHPITLGPEFQDLDETPIQILQPSSGYRLILGSKQYNETFQIKLKDLEVFKYTIERQIERTKGSQVHKNWIAKERKLQQILEEFEKQIK